MSVSIRAELVRPAEDEDEQTAAATSSSSSSSSCCSPARSFLLSHFPDLRTRLLLALTFAAALAISTIWLYYTIHSRWLADVRHPPNRVYTERLDAIPIFEGLLIDWPVGLFTFPTDGTQSSVTFWKCIAMVVLDGVSSPIYPKWTQPVAFPREMWLEPTFNVWRRFNNTADQVDIFQTPPSDTTTDPFARLADTDWPVFRTQLDRLTLTFYAMVNTSLASTDSLYAQFELPDPDLGINLIDAEDLWRTKETFGATGSGGGSAGANVTPAAVLQWEESTPELTDLSWNHDTVLIYSLTKRIQIDGTIRHVWTAAFPTSFQYKSSVVRDLLDPDASPQVWAAYPEDAARLRPLQNHTEMRPLVLAVDILPSFEVTVVEEYHAYNWLTFFSDLGGFLNLLALSFAILFPIMSRVPLEPTPRIFLLDRLWRMWKKHRKGGGAGGAAAGTMAGTEADEAIDDDRSPNDSPAAEASFEARKASRGSAVPVAAAATAIPPPPRQAAATTSNEAELREFLL